MTAQGSLALVHRIGPAARQAARLLLALLALLLAPGMAQAQHVYTNTTDSGVNAINETATPCTAPFERTFVVTDSFSVKDVNIGVMMAHTYRGDLRMFLKAPDGTTIQLIANVGADADNANVLYDDEAASAVAGYTANATATAGTLVPPYETTWKPAAVLTGFDGKASTGTWTLQICDSLNADSGTFYQADLYLTEFVADLSLALSVSNSAPTQGSAVTYTLTLANSAASNGTATGVTIGALLPPGTTYATHSGPGTYNSATGVWTVSSIAPGTNAVLTITATVTASSGASVPFPVQVTASSMPDIDSVPNNGVTSEDDYATTSFTVAGARVAGTPPTLSCSTGTTTFDWDSQTWTTGATSGSFTLTNVGGVGFSMANPGTWVNNATYGGLSPAEQATITGGFSPAQSSLTMFVNLATTSQVATTTITLANAVPGAQFRIFDVDFGAASFADKITVTGSLSGSTVIPTLTNGISNYVTGNIAIGDALSADNQANGNVVVTFSSPVDTIVIQYGNHTTAPANPAQQQITLHDITFCNPNANISVSKTSTVLSDPVNGTATDRKAIPGAVMEYCIVISNAGPAGATSIVAFDTLPATLTYTAGSLLSGTSCAGATTAEDDNNIGGDETDPFGASIAGANISATAGALANGASLAVKFRATVN